MLGFRKKKENVKKKTKKKKKLTCCQRCRRRICKWAYRRCKRCIKKSIFGVPDPQLDDYEVAGINLGDVKEKLNRNKSANSKKSGTNSLKKPTEKIDSIVTVYRNKKKSILSIPFKDKLVKEYDNISLIKPGKLKSLIHDLKERNLYVGLSKDSLIDVNKSEKERLRKKADEFERKYNFDTSNLDLKMLDNLNKSQIKKKFSLTSSKHKVVKAMLSDIKNKNFSLTGLFSKSKVDIDKLDKKDMQKILDRYEARKKHYSYVKQSKLKQLRSDLRAKLADIQ